MFENYNMYPNNRYNQMSMQNYQPNHPQSLNLIRVTGIDGAKAYQMPPNSVVPLFDAENDIMYVKSTDGAGFPTIKTFAFTPYEISQQSNNDYVTRAEFEELKGMIINGKQFISEQTTTEQPI
jgi:hypothetical protein